MASHAEAIRDRAAHWVARLNDNDLSDAERDSLQGWLLADPRHATEFRAHNAVLGLARDFPPDLQARLGALVPAVHHVEPRHRRWVWPAALAASALLTMMVTAWFMSRTTPQPAQSAKLLYTTQTGEMRTVRFPDGSVAYLNTRTRVEWIGGENERVVVLGTGEATFDVKDDATRPFRVMLDYSEIQVLGTIFNVHSKPNGDVIVTVVTGKVAVKERGSGGTRPAWERKLNANQGIAYRQLGLISDVQNVSADSALQWRQSVYEIDNLPLPEVLEELKRYTDKPILIRDPRAAQLRLIGTVSTRDVGVTLRRLEKLTQVKVVETGESFELDYQTNNEDKRNN